MTEPPVDPAGPDVAQWKLPAAAGARLAAGLGRALRRCCPYCEAPGIFASWWTLKEQCPHCRVSFAREDGYFLGAYAVNLVLAEFLGLGAALYLLFGTSLRELPVGWQMVIAGALAAALPMALFPYSRTVWMAIDLAANPPGDNPEHYLRGREMAAPLPRRR